MKISTKIRHYPIIISHIIMLLNQDNTVHCWKYNSLIEFLAWHAHKTLSLIHSTRKRERGREEYKRERERGREGE